MVQRVLRNSKAQPRFIEPMECKRVPKLPEGDDWLYEIKQDGYRVIGLVDGSTALLYSMSGLDYTRQFPHVSVALKNLKQRKFVLDGEIVALDEHGRASFQELQNRKNTQRPIIYYLFDILHLDGKDLLDLPLTERRKILESFGSRFSDPLRLNPIFRTELTALIEQVGRLGLEAVVAKRSGSIYIPGKESDAWQKHRFNQEGEFVIGGYVAAGRKFSSDRTVERACARSAAGEQLTVKSLMNFCECELKAETELRKLKRLRKERALVLVHKQPARGTIHRFAPPSERRTPP